tara:strand:- start:1927 stop:2475 length:549 start_codon:yes stop_codon:yes gene_type:complete
MTHIINYAKLLQYFQHSQKEGDSYLLEDEIKGDVMKMLRHYTAEMLKNGNDLFFHQWGENNYTFDIDQIKLELPEYLYRPIEQLESKLLHLNCRDFMKDLNDLSQYDAFREYDDDIEPFTKYVCTIAEFWLDEFESIQDQYIINRDKNASELIASSYLESIYSPHTMLGRKRFDKERDALFN